MCGICGFYSQRKESVETLIEMNNTLLHRGPDDHGEEFFPLNDGCYCIGMAHRRLSIFDLSPNGHQPMHSPDDEIVVVFNGEIYNFRQLKDELDIYPFHSDCDTEVILAAYIKWGISFVDHINGMYAIALFDRGKEKLFLIRDRIGKKPLYYYLDEDSIYFGSELKALMANEHFNRIINKKIIGKYLYRQYINAPDTVFENTYKLPAGSIIEFHKGKKKEWKYWDIAEQYYEKRQRNEYHTLDDATDEFERLLIDAVGIRMQADVPVGCFLSGGYDSALICAFAQRSNTENIRTYSIGFYDKKLDEAPYAREIANYIGTNHTEHYITEDEMLGLVDSIPEYYDEPFADSSQIATMLVSQLAKKDITVVLSGDGGDEFFGGYPIYLTMGKSQRRRHMGRILKTISKNSYVNKAIYNNMSLPWRILLASDDVMTQGGGKNLHIIQDMILEKEQQCFWDEIENRYNEDNLQIRRMLVDMDTYLPEDILCKVDRASMKYSLETRCPFLDRDLMEFSLGLPLEYKIKGDELKIIIKKCAYRHIPKALLDRPKHGFSVPATRWMQNELNEELHSFMEKKYLVEQEIFDANEVSNLISEFECKGRYSNFVWAWYVFQKWYSRYCI